MTPILRADGVINLAKFKTHMFMIFTGATKNLFGVIPGLNKVGYHARLADPLRFADMLLDVAGFVQSAAEHRRRDRGDGGQRPRDRRASRARWACCWPAPTPVAVDVACCRIAGIDPARCPCLWPPGSGACGAGGRPTSTRWACRWPSCR